MSTQCEKHCRHHDLPPAGALSPDKARLLHVSGLDHTVSSDDLAALLGRALGVRPALLVDPRKGVASLRFPTLYSKC